jgi:hypothetical protein
MTVKKTGGTMLKGVNRNIIEVRDPDSIYFERAVFYLRPGVRKLPAEVSRREINRCICENDIYRRSRLKVRIFKAVLLLAAIAAVVTILLLVL